jgi:hypothetical protein
MNDHWARPIHILAGEVADEQMHYRTLAEAADVLDLHPDMLLEAMKDGRLLPILPARRTTALRFRAKDLLEFALSYAFESPRLRDLEAELERMRERLARLTRTGKVLPSTRKAVIARDGRQCRYCAKLLGPRSALHLDHVIPLSRGGGDDAENLVVACARCNTRKGTRLLGETRMTLLPVPDHGPDRGPIETAFLTT